MNINIEVLKAHNAFDKSVEAVRDIELSILKENRYRLTGTVNGSKFKIAGLGTDLFCFYLEDVNMASPKNLKVSEYKEHLSYWANYFIRLNKRNKC